jgi:hypothetical protein
MPDESIIIQESIIAGLVTSAKKGIYLIEQCITFTYFILVPTRAIMVSSEGLAAMVDTLHDPSATGKYAVLCMLIELVKYGRYANYGYGYKCNFLTDEVWSKFGILEITSAVMALVDNNDIKMKKTIINVLVQLANLGKL